MSGKKHGQSFDHKFQKVVSWADGALQKDDPFLATLTADAPWIAELVEMRNAVEHPGSSSGTFVIEGFRLVPGPAGTRTVAPPTWQRLPSDIRSVSRDMHTFQENLLTFFEDVLADGLKRRGAGGMPVDIMAIPEAERRPETPIRLRAVLLTPPPVNSREHR